MSTFIKRAFHFNSTCEIAIANGSPHFNASALLCQFENDLASIMLLFSNTDDYILCNYKPDGYFLQVLDRLNISRSQFVNVKDIVLMQQQNSKLYFDMQMWGTSPAEDFFLKNIKTTRKIWTDNHRNLFGRLSSIELLNKYIQINNLPSFINKNISSKIIKTEGEAECYLLNNYPVVFKSPYSSSGRGLMVLRKPDLNDSNKKWINTVISQQGYIVASVWLDKLHDLSFQFICNDSGIYFEGCTFFQTNNNGQYKGHLLNPNLSKLELPISELNNVGNMLKKQLSESIFSQHYGRLGIDAIIYKLDNKIFLHPCIEINPRFTMGAVALQAQNLLHKNSKGMLCIHTASKNESYAQYIQKLNSIYQLKIENNKLVNGIVSLTPISNNAKFGCFIIAYK